MTRWVPAGLQGATGSALPTAAKYEVKLRSADVLARVAMGRMDIIFCRYVTIYFAEDFKERIYREIADLLSPDGYLVISAVENLLGLSDRFTPRSHAGGTYYQCKQPD